MPKVIKPSNPFTNVCWVSVLTTFSAPPQILAASETSDYHLHITTCVEAIKPRQIINYDAGIVLIDLHQLNVKTTSDNTNQRH
ncbi:hypothetical protein OURE66S_00741 [Oligella ureolytica]